MFSILVTYCVLSESKMLSDQRDPIMPDSLLDAANPWGEVKLRRVNPTIYHKPDAEQQQPSWVRSNDYSKQEEVKQQPSWEDNQPKTPSLRGTKPDAEQQQPSWVRSNDEDNQRKTPSLRGRVAPSKRRLPEQVAIEPPPTTQTKPMLIPAGAATDMQSELNTYFHHEKWTSGDRLFSLTSIKRQALKLLSKDVFTLVQGQEKVFGPRLKLKMLSDLRDRYREEYGPKLEIRGKKIVTVIVGAGPTGLRLAIEAKLSGADVHIYEKRNNYNRLNCLMLWPSTTAELTDIIVGSIYKNISKGGKNSIPINILENSMLRVALLLGVNFYPLCKFTGFAKDGSTPEFEKQGEEDCIVPKHIDAIYDNTGMAGQLITAAKNASHKDEESVEPVGALAAKDESIAISFNLQPNPTKATSEQLLGCINTKATCSSYICPAQESNADLAYQYCVNLFQGKVSDEAPALLSYVYARKEQSQYFVAQIKNRAELVRVGLCKNEMKGQPWSAFYKECLNEHGTDPFIEKLKNMAKSLADKWNLPKSDLVESPSVFAYGSPTKAKKLFVFRNKTGTPWILAGNGDNAKAPLWPLGTGANHGFNLVRINIMVLRAYASYLNSGKSDDARETLGKLENWAAALKSVAIATSKGKSDKDLEKYKDKTKLIYELANEWHSNGETAKGAASLFQYPT